LIIVCLISCQTSCNDDINTKETAIITTTATITIHAFSTPLAEDFGEVLCSPSVAALKCFDILIRNQIKGNKKLSANTYIKSDKTITSPERESSAGIVGCKIWDHLK
jgi:hypothetical protein